MIIIIMIVIGYSNAWVYHHQFHTGILLLWTQELWAAALFLGAAILFSLTDLAKRGKGKAIGIVWANNNKQHSACPLSAIQRGCERVRSSSAEHDLHRHIFSAPSEYVQ
jgi:hypothetical protein